MFPFPVIFKIGKSDVTRKPVTSDFNPRGKANAKANALEQTAAPRPVAPATDNQNLTCGAALAAAGTSKKAAFQKPNIPASKFAGKLRIATL